MGISERDGEIGLSENRQATPRLSAVPLPVRVWWRELRVRALLPLVSLAALCVVIQLWPRVPFDSTSQRIPETADFQPALDQGNPAQFEWPVGMKSKKAKFLPNSPTNEPSGGLPLSYRSFGTSTNWTAGPGPY